MFCGHWGLRSNFIYFPPFSYTIFSFRQKKQFYLVLLIFAFCGIVKLFFLYKLNSSNFRGWSGIFFQTTTHIDSIFFSVWFGVNYNYINERISKYKKYVNFIILASLITWTFLSFYFFSSPETSNYLLLLYFPYTAYCSVVLIYFLCIIKSPVDNLIHKAIVYLGKLSFGIYLFHMPIFLILKEFDLINVNSSMNFIYISILSIAFSHFVYQYFEIFFRKISLNKYSTKHEN